MHAGSWDSKHTTHAPATAQVNRGRLGLFRSRSVFSPRTSLAAARRPICSSSALSSLSSAGRGVDAPDRLRVRLRPRMPERAGSTTIRAPQQGGCFRSDGGDRTPSRCVRMNCDIAGSLTPANVGSSTTGANRCDVEPRFDRVCVGRRSVSWAILNERTNVRCQDFAR